MISLDEIYCETFDEAFDLAGDALPIAGVRRDADTSPVTNDGDAHPFLFDSQGFLKVNSKVTVEASDAEYAEDSAHSDGDVGLQILAVRQDTLSSSVDTDGDYGSLKLNSLGRLYTTTVVEGGINDFYDTDFKVTAETIGATAAELVSTPMTGRKKILVQNEGDKPIYIGYDNTVTTSNGIKISKNSSWTELVGENLDIWAISTDAGQSVRIMEIG